MKPDAGERDLQLAGRPLLRTSVRGNRNIEYLEDPFGGGLALHPGVAVSAELAQGPVELGRQEQHQEGVLEGDGAVDQAHPQDHRDERYGGGRHELEHQPGEERVAQHLQGTLPELAANPLHLLFLGRDASERLERRQALQGVEEVRAHAREREPLAPRVLLGVAPDQDHHHRYNRRGNDQQHRAGDVARKDVAHYQQRNGGAQEDLRQVAGEVRIQPLDTLRQGRRQLAGTLAAGECRSQLQHVGEQPLPEVVLYPDRASLRRRLPDPEQPGPQQPRFPRAPKAG